MSVQAKLNRRIAFGPFESDQISGQLRKHGLTVRLQGQPQQILSLLLSKQGEVVTREELQGALWPGANTGDFEHGINAAVNKLRQVLGDSADQPRYIETLAGRGYRFIAPVEIQSGKALLEMGPVGLKLMPKTPVAVFPKFRWAVLSALAALVLLLGAAAWRAIDRPAVMRPLQFTVEPPQGFALEGAGNRHSFALSPDGTRLAFTAMDASGRFRIFIRDLHELESRPVPESEGAYTVFWREDGAYLYFTARGKLRRVAASGGAVQTVVDSFPYLSSGVFLEPERLLLSSFKYSRMVAARTGAVEWLKRAYPWPQALGDKSHFLYTVPDWDKGLHSVRISSVALDGEGQHVLTTGSRALFTQSMQGATGYLLYIRGGTLTAQPFDAAKRATTGDSMPLAENVPSFFVAGAADFSASDKGVLGYQRHANRSQIVWVDRQGKQISTATPGNLSTKSAAASPDGKYVATAIYNIELGGLEIWLYDREGTGRKFASGIGMRFGPVWAPDSRTLVYSVSVGGSPRLHSRSLDEGAPERALPQGDFMSANSWSKDGRFVVYNNSGLMQATGEQQSDVYAIDLNRNKVVPLLNTEFFEANAVLSPDGRWLAFTSNESGASEMYVRRVEVDETIRAVGERYRVTRAGAQCLRWRPDGKELFYLGYDGAIYGVPMKLGSAAEAGKAERLFTLQTEARAAIHGVVSFDISADGKRFAIPTVSDGPGPAIVVVQNWEEALLKKR